MVWASNTTTATSTSGGVYFNIHVTTRIPSLPADPHAAHALRPFYECLGLPCCAPGDKIRREYRRLVKLYHPDVGGDAARFRSIHEAYVALKKERLA